MPRCMNCNAISLGITSLILMTVSKNLALSQKILEDWLRLPESQELFAGLVEVVVVMVVVSSVASTVLDFYTSVVK